MAKKTKKTPRTNLPISQSSNSIVQEFDPARVKPLPDQPRKRFRGIRELADSILEIGQATPGIVTPIKGDKDFDAQLIDGERRLRACKLAGVKFRAEIRELSPCEYSDLFTRSFVANFGKQDHDHMEIADGLGRLREMGKTLYQMAKLVGKSGSWVEQHLLLLKLDPAVQEMMIPQERDDEDDARTHVPFSIAMQLAALPAEAQKKLAQRIIDEGMSIAASRRLVFAALRNASVKHDALSPRKNRLRLKGLSSTLSGIDQKIGIFLDLPGKDFDSMINDVEIDDRRELINAINTVTDNLSAIADAIEEHCPKPVKPARLTEDDFR